MMRRALRASSAAALSACSSCRIQFTLGSTGFSSMSFCSALKAIVSNDCFIAAEADSAGIVAGTVIAATTGWLAGWVSARRRNSFI